MSNPRTTVATLVQVVAGVQPAGSKAKVVAPLLIAGFTVHCGWPLPSATMRVCGSKVIVFFVPATCAVVWRDTCTSTVSPASPLADPTLIVATIGDGVAVGDTVNVAVTVLVGPGGCVGVAVAVARAVALAVGAPVAVVVGVIVAVAVPVGMPVGAAVIVAVAVPVGIPVGDAVTVAVAVSAGVPVGLAVGV